MTSIILLIISSENLYFIIWAGTPPTIAYGGTSFVTIAPVAIIAPLPICTPDLIHESSPIHTSSSTIIGPFVLHHFPFQIHGMNKDT